MNDLLNEFWKWLKKTPEEYAASGLEYVNNCMEFDYPQFEELKKSAIQIVDKNIMNGEAIYNLLTIMALDNESENILDYLEDNSSNEQLQMIIEIGMTHIQPEARWQLAELIYRRLPRDHINYLLALTNDDNAYVKKRAQNCIEQLNIQL